MTDENRALRIGRAPLVAFVPALALALAVTLLMRAAYDAVGLTAIFWSFGVGVALAAVAEAGNALRVVERETAESALAAGVSLTVAAVLLYAVFGCPA